MVFSAILPRKRKPDADVAVPVVVRHISCPYCGNVFSIMTLGSLRHKVDPEPEVPDGRGGRIANPEFGETHLANPITCPSCGRNFIAFVGVEFDEWSRSIKDVHVKLMKPDDPVARKLARWPHIGLVDPTVVEYRPFELSVYQNLDHFQEYNEDMSDIKAASLPSNGVPSGIPGSGYGDFDMGVGGRADGRRYPPPKKIPVGLNLRSRRRLWIPGISF